VLYIAKCRCNEAVGVVLKFQASILYVVTEPLEEDFNILQNMYWIEMLFNFSEKTPSKDFCFLYHRYESKNLASKVTKKHFVLQKFMEEGET